MIWFLWLLIVLNSVTNVFAQNPSEVFIRQTNVEHNEAEQQFTVDFTTAFPGQMALDSCEEYDTDINNAIVKQFGVNNISMLIQKGTNDVARNDRYSKAIKLIY